MAKIKVPDGRGFDIVIWQKSVNDPAYAAAYTLHGRDHLKSFFRKVSYRTAYNLDGIFPKELLKNTTGLNIGGISPGTRVPMLINPPLH